MPKRPVVVERERERAHRPRGRRQPDAHVHGDAQLRMGRTLQDLNVFGEVAGLVLEQVHRMAGVMPQQVVGPAPGLAQRVDVGAAEEEGLGHQVLKLQLPGLDPPMHPLVARVEASHVVHHRDQAGGPLYLDHPLGAHERIRHRDLDEHVFAGVHHLLGLPGVQRRRRGEDGRLHPRLAEALVEIHRPVGDPVLAGHGLGVLGHAAHDGCDLHAFDARQRIEVLVRERPFSNHADLHEFRLPPSPAFPCCRFPTMRMLISPGPRRRLPSLAFAFRPSGFSCVPAPSVARLSALPLSGHEHVHQPRLPPSSSTIRP